MDIKINDKLYNSITEYCAINSMDIEKYINTLLKKWFMLDKYGEKPSINTNSEKIEEKMAVEEKKTTRKKPISIPTVIIEEELPKDNNEAFAEDTVYPEKETTEEEVVEVEKDKKKPRRKLK